LTAEVVVVGGGLAGTLSAILLGRQGIRTILVDPFSPVPSCFKAEKIEPDQIAYLEEFGLMDALLPHSGTIREVLEAKGGRILKLTRIRQHGVRYHEMVNVVRGHLPPQVDFRVGRVRDVVPGPERQDVRLADGNGIGGRIVLLASGTGGDLATRVGPPRQTIQREQSVCFGFDLARSDGRPFPFESLTYYPDGCRSGVGYLTVFPIRDVMRANLFTFWPQRDPRTAAFVREPAAALARTLPGLTSLVGSLEVLGRAESARIDLFRVEARAQGGLVPMADAYQSVCPTTGSGLSKVLTDVDVLCHELVPDWLSTPGLGPEKTARWYDHPRKRRVDEKSLRTAAYRRQLSLDPSLGWRLHRARVYSSMWLVGRTDSFRLTRKLTA
jgi:2-polyprenyl-6-methoxyphenol hydroxylase-like FAD-dependent oxidoreductase